ncbi:hypothetical protein B0H16DRAFT_1753596 [Mycena metata]|uniref:LysM domain-containing protein n=1 Tax=Mycena metata TaxID=1033252 RepID=A0AAD7KHG0_9AGAR|nr:hypothetical protein B0H16DRAFT_1753596 [Mycena metata]
MVVLRRLSLLGFYTFAALDTMPTFSKAAPLAASRPNIRAVRYGRPHSRQDDIASLVGNITGQTVSDPAALAQTLGSLFNPSATTGTPSPTISGLLSQITANASVLSITTSDDAPSAAASDLDSSFGDSILSQFTSTAAVPIPTDDGADSGAGDAWSLLSQLVGAIPTSLPSMPVSPYPTGEAAGNFGGTDGSSWSSEGPGANSYGVGTFLPLGSGATSHKHGGHRYGGMASQQQLDDYAETYTVVAGDTFDAVSTVFDLSPVEFLRMNPSVGAACMNLQLGQEDCVRRSAGGGYGYDDKETVVHIHNHPWPGMPPQAVHAPPAIPSGGPFTSANGLPVPLPPTSTPALPTSDPNLNATMATDPGIGSTAFGGVSDFGSSGFNSTIPGDLTAFNSTMAIAGGNSTNSGVSNASASNSSAGDLLDHGSSSLENATSSASGGSPLSTPALNGTDTQTLADVGLNGGADATGSGMAAREPASSPGSSRKKVEVEWNVEEDF